MKLRRLAVAAASINHTALLLHRRPELLTDPADTPPARRWPRDGVVGQFAEIGGQMEDYDDLRSRGAASALGARPNENPSAAGGCPR